MTEAQRTHRQQQALESRQRLMDTALELFARQGYSQTTVHAICARLKVADSLLYHYFPGGKQELMGTIVQENMLRLLGELNSRNGPLEDLPLPDLMEQLYQGIEETVLRYRDIIRVFIQEPEVRGLVTYGQLRVLLGDRLQWFPALLRSRAEKGEIRPMDYESAAQILDSAVLHHLTLEVTGFSPGPLSDPEHRRKLIDYQIRLWQGGREE